MSMEILYCQREKQTCESAEMNPGCFLEVLSPTAHHPTMHSFILTNWHWKGKPRLQSRRKWCQINLWLISCQVHIDLILASSLEIKKTSSWKRSWWDSPDIPTVAFTYAVREKAGFIGYSFKILTLREQKSFEEELRMISPSLWDVNVLPDLLRKLLSRPSPILEIDKGGRTAFIQE